MKKNADNAEISSKGFEVLAKLLGMRGKSMEAARRVMVEGESMNDVSHAMELPYTSVYTPVKRARAGILNARAVVLSVRADWTEMEKAVLTRGRVGRKSREEMTTTPKTPARKKKPTQLVLSDV